MPRVGGGEGDQGRRQHVCFVASYSPLMDTWGNSMPKTVNYIFLIYSEKKAHEGILCDADRGLLNDINGFTYVLTVDFPITFSKG